mmetsp:Transcript_24661/g.45328  ORF Transcript_24661/g.45328 Transcript_24661/m.45328 type:complete len:275 (-) Transcript_24661:219-1043(-)
MPVLSRCQRPTKSLLLRQLKFLLYQTVIPSWWLLNPRMKITTHPITTTAAESHARKRGATVMTIVAASTISAALAKCIATKTANGRPRVELLCLPIDPRQVRRRVGLRFYTTPTSTARESHATTMKAAMGVGRGVVPKLDIVGRVRFIAMLTARGCQIVTRMMLPPMMLVLSRRQNLLAFLLRRRRACHLWKRGSRPIRPHCSPQKMTRCSARLLCRRCLKLLLQSKQILMPRPKGTVKAQQKMKMRKHPLFKPMPPLHLQSLNRQHRRARARK